VTLRIGLVGCGRWGALILRDLLALGAEVHVLTRSEASTERALQRGAATAVTSPAALGAVEGFVVATPTVSHAAVIETLIPLGRPIFVEKPITNSAAAAKRIVDMAGERVFVMDKWRYHPGIEALAAVAQSGELGEIRAIRSYRLGFGNPHRDVDAIWILLPHDLAIALEILGHLPAAHTAFAPVPGRDDFIAVFADGDGVGPRVTTELAASHPIERRSIVVVGSRRSAQLGGAYEDRIIIAEHGPAGDKRPVDERPVSGEMPLTRELRAFLEHLSGGPPPRSSAQQGLLIVERVAAARRLAGLAD
jgi:predicted dehydrogenase